MSYQNQAPFDWTLWLQWVLLTSVGWILSWMLGPDVAWIAAGAVIGLLQWVVLRQRLRQAGWWILASAIGWGGGWGLVISVVPLEMGILTEPLLGMAIGTLQWLVLRRQLRQAGWWIVVSALSWTVALTGLTGQLLVGAVVGAVTGIVLELLLRYPGLLKTQAQAERKTRSNTDEYTPLSR